MTQQQIAVLEAAELERWYRLPSPTPQAPSVDLVTPVVFGLCLACAVFALITQSPHGV